MNVGHKTANKGSKRRRRNLFWAELMRRVFGIDVLACPECEGRCRIIACIEDPVVFRKILAHLRLPATGVQLHPACRPPQLDFVGAVELFLQLISPSPHHRCRGKGAVCFAEEFDVGFMSHHERYVKHDVPGG